MYHLIKDIGVWEVNKFPKFRHSVANFLNELKKNEYCQNFCDTSEFRNLSIVKLCIVERFIAI